MDSSNESPAQRDNPKSNTLPHTLLRYTLSSEEYKDLYRHAVKRLPDALRTKAPHPSKYVSPVGSNDYNAAAVRASIRLFLVAQAGLKAWDYILAQLLRRGRPQAFGKSHLSTFRAR